MTQSDSRESKPETVFNEADGNALKTNTTIEASATAQPVGEITAASAVSVESIRGSKGVDYYSYLDQNGQFSAVFTKPVDDGNSTRSFTHSTAGAMQKDNLQIDGDDIGWTEATGRYRWEARKGNTVLAGRFAEISPLTGNLGATDMGRMLRTPSQFGPDWAVSYGFYDSGNGKISGLTNQDQSYVYITRNQSDWMGELARSLGSAFTDKPFSALALPGSHDAGMFDDKVLGNLIATTAFLAYLAPVIGSGIITLAAPMIHRAAVNFGMTQKDNIADQLKLGVRYFDFRPGHCVVPFVGIYHQHAVIPGYSYQKFLEDVLNFLKHHPAEIVVVSANFQGIAFEAMKPMLSELEESLSAARKATGTQNTIVAGNKQDLRTTYQSLIAADKRLIFLNQVGAPDDATKYDSYTEDYKTTDVNVILRALETMTASGQSSADYTVLQLQGTATGLGGGKFASIATVSDASSPLLSTKPGFDNKTYPWLKANVTPRLSPEKLVVFLNDFADNALVSAAIEVTKQRVTQAHVPMPDLCFINTKKTPGGTIELRRSYGAGGYKDGRRYTTTLSPADADNGFFQVVDTDLWFIKTKNTGSGKVELHQRTAQSGYRTGLSTVIDLLPNIAAQGWLQMTRSGLWYIRTKGWTNPLIAVQQFTAASNYHTGHSANTNIPDNEADNGVFQMVGDDLWFIKTKNTRSGFIEIRQRTAASGYQSGIDQVIDWRPGEVANGRLQIVVADLWYIQTKQVPANFVRLHQRTAKSRYMSVVTKDSGLMARDVENGVFQLV